MIKLLFGTALLLCVSPAAAREVQLHLFTSIPAGTFQLIEPGRGREQEPATAKGQPGHADEPLVESSSVFRPRNARPNVAPVIVPAWMRQGGGNAHPFRSTGAGLPRASYISCTPVSYQPYAGLSPSGEARRRLYFRDMTDAACAAGVPVHLFDSLIVQESRYNPRALSRAGAIGMAQLMPGTARDLNVTDAWDVRQNLAGGARYLRQQLDEFGEWHLALSAYNAGPGQVRRYRAVPPFRETTTYVRLILAGVRLNLQDGRTVAEPVQSTRQVRLSFRGL